MPNHFHGIIELKSNVGADPRVCPLSEIEGDKGNGAIELNVGADPRVCPSSRKEGNNKKGGDTEKQGGHAGPPLHEVVQWFKTMTTNAYFRGVKEQSWPPVNKRLWQRNYYEHIIRDDAELNDCSDYIINNPLNWHTDENYEESIPLEMISWQFLLTSGSMKRVPLLMSISKICKLTL